MKEIKDFKFDISITTKGINKNNLKNVCNDLIFITEQISLQSLNERMKEGYTYTSVLNKKIWKYQGTKKTDLFKQTNVISIDLDNIKESINITELQSYLKYIPSFRYTSTNHGKRKENEKRKYSRFRLLYIFDTPITSKEIYVSIQNEIIKGFDVSIFDNTKGTDNTHKDITRIYCGNNTPNYESVITNYIYSQSDFNYKTSSNIIEKKIKKVSTIKEISLNLDKSIFNDFMKMSYDDFLSFHLLKYDIITEEKGRYNKEGYYLASFPDMERNKYKIHKDGEMRRKTLWNWAIYRKQLKPNISIEEQLYNIVYDVVNFMDNSDGQLNKREMLNNILISSIKYNPNFESNRKYIKIDKDYCKEIGTTPANYIKKIKHDWKWEIIENNYNPNLSIRQNLKEINALSLTIPTGEKISLSINTLRKWIDERKENQSINNSIITESNNNNLREDNKSESFNNESNKDSITINTDNNKESKQINNKLFYNSNTPINNTNEPRQIKHIDRPIKRRLNIIGNETEEELKIIYENRERFKERFLNKLKANIQLKNNIPKKAIF